MPYPVPPPEPPAIVQPAPRALKAPASTGDRAAFAKANAIELAKPSPPEWMPTAIQDLRSVQRNAAALSGTEAASSTRSTLSEDIAPLQLSQTTAQFPSPSAPLPSIPSVPGAPSLPAPIQPTAPPPTNIPTTQLNNQGILQLRANSQNYDERRQIFTAEGNVSLRFRGALLTGDRLQVNLLNRLAVAEGNVTLIRGDQVLRGRLFRYNLVQEEGTIEQASGEIFLPSAQTDFNPNLPTNITVGTVPVGSVGDRVSGVQPGTVTQAGGARLTLGSRRNVSGATVIPTDGGTVRRLRFEANQIQFYPEGWLAREIRITNDPFSPPELELRADRAELRRISPLRDEVTTRRSRLVFDQGFSLPLLRNRLVLDRSPRSPALANIGYDAEDRGGIFIERSIDVIPQGPAQFTVVPQFYPQRAIQSRGTVADLFGVRSQLFVPLSPRTLIRGEASLTSLDFSQFQNTFRGSLRAQQLIGTHTLSLEASYRDRLFNNSLGFQDVQSSIGALFYSPVVPIGRTGINLSYQVGFQFINANTDRPQLLAPVRENNRINLSRFQASVAASKGFTLWQGQALPATPTQGLRYSPVPIRPFIGLGVGLTGVAAAYSSGDRQNNLNATVSLFGQFGHFSRPFLDYTAFNISYSQVFLDGLSPFLFDRVADTRILFAGITQQIYGPFRIGFQTAYNVQTGREISTDYILEYSRRTYNIALRYNPVQQLGSISFQISDFNWTRGSTEPFEGSGVIPVEGGVRRLPE